MMTYLLNDNFLVNSQISDDAMSAGSLREQFGELLEYKRAHSLGDVSKRLLRKLSKNQSASLGFARNFLEFTNQIESLKIDEQPSYSGLKALLQNCID